MGDKEALSLLPTMPDLDDGLSLYAQAYIELDTERKYLAPIPWSKIAFYSDFYKFNEEQTEWLFELIRRIDNKILAKRLAKAKGQNHANASRSRKRYR